MKYCTRCIIPDTRPHLELDAEGVCNACRSHESRSRIDWSAREAAFRAVVANAKSRSGGYDCLIPVSGGKDSTWQTITCLEYGLKPLAVTWKTPARTPLGQRNLDNLVSLGVDHIDFQISPAVEKKFMRIAFERFGSTAVPMHLALFNIPLNLAVKFEIPLVVWGENSAFEYGGREEERTGFRLDQSWLARHGVTHGTTAEDWVSEELSRKDLTAYFGPNADELERHGINAVFLGYYFPFDPEHSYQVASKHGFVARDEGARTGYWNYADIDDDFISIHHYLKWHKFGFTRLFDNLSVDIRNGRITRDDAIRIVRETGHVEPAADIATFCRFANLSRERFTEIAESFRNPAVWQFRDGRWVIDDFLIPDWAWT